MIAEISHIKRELSYVAYLGGAGNAEGRAISITPDNKWVFVVGNSESRVAPAAQWLAIGASLGSLLALLAALWVVIPRRSIALPGSESSDYRPISFYGYVATQYAPTEFRRFEHDVAQFDADDFSRESLAEHFMVSRIVKNKTSWVTISGALTFTSMALAGAALLVKTIYG